MMSGVRMFKNLHDEWSKYGYKDRNDEKTRTRGHTYVDPIHDN